MTEATYDQENAFLTREIEGLDRAVENGRKGWVESRQHFEMIEAAATHTEHEALRRRALRVFRKHALNAAEPFHKYAKASLKRLSSSIEE